MLLFFKHYKTMKQTIKLFSVAVIAGAVSVGGYKILESKTDAIPQNP